jgi:nicotinamide-nucleotide amidase
VHLELLTIGDELLLGETIDTNAAHIARVLAEFGVRVVRRATVGDDPDDIEDALRDALRRTGAVITTGGLGPTADDRTHESVAQLLGRPLVLHEGALVALQQRWRDRFQREMPESNRRQCLLPEGAELLENRYGSAPGSWIADAEGRWIATLPGVPREMRGMLADMIVPRLLARRDAALAATGATPLVVRSRMLRTTSIAESALADRLGDLRRSVAGLPLAFLPGVEGVDLRVTAYDLPSDEADRRLAEAIALLRERAGDFVYGEGGDDLATLVLDGCLARGATLAVAESCTGGLLGARITAVAGASRVFMGGTLAYANEVKVRELGVAEGDLVAHGAVSEPVARAMATGVRTRFGTTVGVGITGVAGPGGGSAEKPVGTVWVAVDLDGTVHAVRAVLPGDRSEIRARAAQLALDRVRRAFDRHTDAPGWTMRA